MAKTTRKLAPRAPDPPGPAPRYDILCLDGGGIRGLVTAVWLKALADRLERPLREQFKLIAGTSTGSILACAVGLGFEPQRIIDLYRTRGREIFPETPERLWSRLGRVFTQGPSAPKYDGAGLRREIQAAFGAGTRLGDLPVRTMITAYDTLNRNAKVFKSWHDEDKGLRVHELVVASCSAPTYFPAQVMTIGSAELPLIDGGVFANNPTACALAEAIRINIDEADEALRVPLSKFIVASFGTGEATRPIPIRAAREWGAMEWAIPAISVLFDGANDAVDYIAAQMVARGNYFRIQTPLDHAYDDMDDASESNMNALVAVAEEYLENKGGDGALDLLARRLREG